MFLEVAANAAHQQKMRMAGLLGQVMKDSASKNVEDREALGANRALQNYR